MSGFSEFEKIISTFHSCKNCLKFDLNRGIIQKKVKRRSCFLNLKKIITLKLDFNLETI